MNSRWVRPAAAVLMLLAATAVRAQISEDEAEKLMHSCGLWQQVGNAAPGLRAGVAKSLAAPGNKVPEDLRAKVQAAADAAFVPERMQAVARRSVADSVRRVHLPALAEWCATPDGAAIAEAEVVDSRDDGAEFEARMKAGLAILVAAPEPRRRLIARISEVTRAGQTGADMVANVAVALQLGLARVNPSGPQPTERELRAPLEEQRPALLKAFEGVVLTSFARAYKDLPDAMLERYVAFLSSAAGEHFTDVGLAAVEAAVLDAIATMGRAGR